MVESIQHDAMSTTATVAGKAAKWGLIGAIAAFAVPAVVIGGGGLLLGAAVASLATGPVMGAIASLAGLAISVTGILGGIAAGTASAASFGGTAAVGGALVGVAKGGNQVSRENAAYRDREKSLQFADARKANDREIRGMQQGYAIARADMEPMIQQREQAAFQKGQELVVSQLQEQMNAQMKAQAGATQTATADVGGKQLSLKCESKAEAKWQERMDNEPAASLERK